MSAPHPLVAKLAAVQQAQRNESDRLIDAQEVFVQRRVRAASHRRGRAILEWATANGHAKALCFTELAKAIANGEPIAFLLMACWADFPESQEVA